jgi:acetyl-CoA synthetase
VVNVSGHRISTAEVQEAIKAHPAFAEVAAVGRPHEIKGQSIATFVTLSGPSHDPDSLELDVHRMVCDFLGPYEAPTDIFVVGDLPRTHSGKQANRYLMKLAAQEHHKSIIDVSMIQNTSILAELETKVLRRVNY